MKELSFTEMRKALRTTDCEKTGEFHFKNAEFEIVFKTSR